MYGGVGRGKSFLMDCFFHAVPLTRKTRLHFHEFMREVHRELPSSRARSNPLHELGQRIARRYPADLLRRVPRRRRHRRDDPAPPARRDVREPRQHRDDLELPPDELYPNGLHRDRILPAIELLKDKLEVDRRRQRHRLPRAHAGAASSCTTRRSAPRPTPR
jgi:cell division protein ZapE